MSIVRKPRSFRDSTATKPPFLLLWVLLTVIPLYPRGAGHDNIIIISVDTLRADHLGCYGYPVNTSPEIDRFSKDAVLFSRSFTVTPLTAPAFSTMLTSLPPHKHGAKRNGLSVYGHIESLPGYLGKNGYRSAAFISNWPLRKKLFGMHRHFHHYTEILNLRRYMGIMNREGDARDVTEQAVRWLKNNRKEPMFLWVHYSDPHAPYIFHTEYNFRYPSKRDSVFPPRSNMKNIRKYDSEIRYADHFIGEFLEELRGLGLYEKSLIVFNSDHGESFGEHHYVKHGRMLYNSCMKVPLMVKLPGNRDGGTVLNHNVSIIDIAPTILETAGLEVPGFMEGRNVFKRESGAPVFFETYKGAAVLSRSRKAKLKSNPVRYGALVEDTKLIFTRNSAKFELYNIDEDRFEVQNRYEKKGPAHGLLKKELIQFVSGVNKFIRVFSRKFNQVSEISGEDLEMLKTLGYIE